MKRFLMLLIILVLCLIAVPALALAENRLVGSRTIVSLTATGDGSGNATLTISGNDFAAVQGKYFKGIETDPFPGADAPTAWTGYISDANGMRVLTIPTRSTTDKQALPGHITIGDYWPIKNGWSMTLTGIGAGNKVKVEFIFH